ncbi:VCBS repeat-containing protein, partial [Mycoplana sp. BE70]|uniref:putative Ig domain-containing protein n=1 Tax=Mycoplana sp. BE70 TaxID=2817775 RepID=UPI00285C0077
GSFTFDAATGAWTYTLDGRAQALKEDQSVDEALEVASIDGTTKTITVTVTGTNDAAVITGALTGSVTEDTAATTGGTLTVTDADTGETGFQAADASALVGTYGSFTFNEATGAWTYTLDARAQALTDGETVDETLEVASIDGTTKTITVTVTGSNDAPTVATPITDRTTNEDVPFSFAVPANTFADVDGDELTLSASLANGDPLPGWLRFDPATGTFSGTAENADVGPITVKVTANDGNGGTVTAEFTLTVVNNDAPTVENPIADQAVNEDTAIDFTVPANTFDDVDGDTLTLTATLANGDPLPGWLSFDPATGTFSGTPENADVGSIMVKVTADDGKGGTVSDEFTLTVANTNDDPTVANPIDDQSTDEDAAFTFQVPADTFAD